LRRLAVHGSEASVGVFDVDELLLQRRQVPLLRRRPRPQPLGFGPAGEQLLLLRAAHVVHARRHRLGHHRLLLLERGAGHVEIGLGVHDDSAVVVVLAARALVGLLELADLFLELLNQRVALLDRGEFDVRRQSRDHFLQRRQLDLDLRQCRERRRV
jgi:hypothetical protein